MWLLRSWNIGNITISFDRYARMRRDHYSAKAYAFLEIQGVIFDEKFGRQKAKTLVNLNNVIYNPGCRQEQVKVIAANSKKNHWQFILAHILYISFRLTKGEHIL